MKLAAAAVIISLFSLPSLTLGIPFPEKTIGHHHSKKLLLLGRANPFSKVQSEPVMPIAPPHIQAMITCNLVRPGHTLWTDPATIRKIYPKLWKHGGEFEAPPGEIKQIACEKTSGVWVLNTVCC